MIARVGDLEIEATREAHDKVRVAVRGGIYGVETKTATADEVLSFARRLTQLVDETRSAARASGVANG